MTAWTIGSPIELATGEGLREATKDVLVPGSSLTAREAKVLRMRFGIDMKPLPDGLI